LNTDKDIVTFTNIHWTRALKEAIFFLSIHILHWYYFCHACAGKPDLTTLTMGTEHWG